MQLPWQKKPLALNSPRDLPGLALWLDSKDVSSLRNDAGAQPVTTDGIKLASDKSGNSSTNVLCLNGVAGNYASAPDSVALSITGSLDIRVNLAKDNWAPGATNTIVQKSGSYALGQIATGRLRFLWVDNGSVIRTIATTAVAPYSSYGDAFIRVTFDPATGTAVFYTGSSMTSWTVFETPAAFGATTIIDSTGILELGSSGTGASELWAGRLNRAQIYNGIAGTLVFDANFATAAKLAPSFTESSSNAATVTINTSGATGARISGARDLYQGTAANQPILTIAAAGNYLTFDGSNDYLKAAAFSLSQPETVYFVGSQVTWTSNDKIYDGNSATERMALLQYTGGASPQIGMFAGTTAGPYSTWAVATNAVITAMFNGASGAFRVNRGTASAASANTQSGNGFTLGAALDGTAPANITAQEVLVYSGAHDKATQDRVIAYLANRNRIALT